MASRELRLELCWDHAYIQDFPTSEAFTCKVTWFFGLLLTILSRGFLISGIAQSLLGVIIMPGTRTSQLRATLRSPLYATPSHGQLYVRVRYVPFPYESVLVLTYFSLQPLYQASLPSAT